MLDKEDFKRSAFYRLDYSRPPPGWPIRPGDRARSVDVLSDLLTLPDNVDVGSYLIDELPLPGNELPAFDDQSGGPTILPPGLIEALPDAHVNPIIPKVSYEAPIPQRYEVPAQNFAVKKQKNTEVTPIFDLTPIPTEGEDHPPTPILPVDDPLQSQIELETHGSTTEWHENHCSTSGCKFPKGHSGPCQNMLPDADRFGVNPDAPRTLRPRHRGHYTKQEIINLQYFISQSTFMESEQVSVLHSVNFSQLLYTTAYDNTIFNAQPELSAAAAIPIPKSIHQALASEHAELWREAIYKEYHSILSHDVFSVVRLNSLPSDTFVMRCHCLFSVKPNSDGSVERFKCRMVTDGKTQTYGVNFSEIFSTVVKFSTFRMALHIAAVRDYDVTAIDISTAFLHGKIDVPNCYMQMPVGLPQYDSEGNKLVCHLKKSIYGLKQAPRIWFNHFKSSLTLFGFTQSEVDPCLFFYIKNNIVIYGLLWVDDLILLSNDQEVRSSLITFLRDKYKLTDKGNAEWLLGMAISRDRTKRTITLSQELYVKNLLTRFSSYMDKSNARSFDIPGLDEISSFSADQGPSPGTPEHERMIPLRHVYMQIVGALVWLSSCTFPHLCVVTNILSRFSINPKECHLAALIRVLLYLRKHPDHTLTLGGMGSNAEVLSIITDASHEDGPSISGVMIIMGTALIDWICRRQHTTSRSSLESEAKANAEGAQDGIYKRELAKEFGVTITTTNFYTDSDSSIKLHKDAYACKKSKHIIRMISMLRHWILTKVYAIKFIAGTKNYADLLTKPLALDPYTKFRDAILTANIVLPDSSRNSDSYGSNVSAFLSYLTAD